MAASSIFFNGRLIRKPGSYSEVDASGLEGVGLAAAGIVALVGTCEGGRPAGTIEKVVDIPRFRNPSSAQNFARSGKLKEAAAMAFNPSNDPNIQGGAAEVMMIKVNPATQSSATLSNSSGASLVISSADYGEFANQIGITIANGTNKGKLVTAVFEGQTESFDDLGGDTMFSLLYRPASGAAGVGWSTMTAEVISTGLRCNATSVIANTASDVLRSDTGSFTANSTNAADTSQTLFVLGVDSGAAVLRSVQLNGTSDVTVGDFSGGVFGAYLSAACAGNVDVDQTANANLTITAGAMSTGGIKGGAFFVSGGTVTATPSASSTSDVYVIGRTAAGARVIDTITLSGTGTITGAASLVEVEAVITGRVATGTVTIGGTALQTANTTQSTIQKMADFANARQAPNAGTPAEPYGFNLTLVTGQTTLASSNLDLTASPVNIDLPTTGSFFADLHFLEQAIDTQFSLINAAKQPGAVGVPDNTTSQVFLTGGGEGTASMSDWQAALNLLRRVRVSTIVPLTSDAAVHAALSAHCEFMAGIGRNERDGIVGLQNTAQTAPPTLAEITTQVVALNTRHLRAAVQNVERFNVAGERTTFEPYFTAVLGAGMQAGSGVGVSLTSKIANCLSAQQDAGWNPIDDSETLLERGAFFLEEVENVGRRWVRNITTNVSSSNVAFTEASVNEAVNFAVFNLRTNLEFAVGRPGFAGTINATKSIAFNTVGLLVDQAILTSFRSLDVALTLDILDVSCEIAPVVPVNFVRSVLHLVNQTQTAA